MKNLKLYEDFQEEVPLETKEGIHFEVETDNFTTTENNEYGDYEVYFKNSENQETSIKVSVTEIVKSGDIAMCNLRVIEKSSTDEKNYTAVGYFEESKEMEGALVLKKVLVEQI
jgi:hypothetical protein